ncbi:MAG TPA: Gfo/Idh/MocA family oxidoreductase [bacterium]|jgi:predicted dehydrogenase|nr:Gfo/Idh/MocA family oxidoreductase [bacterium]
MALRVGVIGTGFGAQVQIPALRAHPRVEVAAVCSGTPGRAESVAAEFDIPQAFDDSAGLIAADVDLVSITTPPHLHHSMALAAAAAGRHVLCEKPMALNAAESAEMLASAEQRGVVHLIDHELRFNPNRRKIKSLIDDGFIGRPRQAMITVVGSRRANPSEPWSWWSDLRQGGGLLNAQGSHQVDLLRYWLGEVESVVGTTRTFIKERPTDDGSTFRTVTSDDAVAYSMRFASGAIGHVTLSAVAAHASGPRAEIWGSEGTLLLDQERLWGGRRGRDLQEMTDAETLAPAPGMDYAPLWGRSFIRLVDHLVAALLDGAPLAPAATFVDGLKVQQVLDAVRTSTREGWVRI